MTKRRKKETRGRPRSRFPPTKAQYHRMAVACVMALVDHEKFIVMVAPTSLRLDGIGFPQLNPTGEPDTYRVNARTLLDWLHENGHTKFSSKLVVEQRRLLLLRLTALEKMFDMSEASGDNGVSLEATNEGENDEH